MVNQSTSDIHDSATCPTPDTCYWCELERESQRMKRQQALKMLAEAGVFSGGEPSTLTDADKTALAQGVVQRARDDLNDGRPLTEMRVAKTGRRDILVCREDAARCAEIVNDSIRDKGKFAAAILMMPPYPAPDCPICGYPIDGEGLCVLDAAHVTPSETVEPLTEMRADSRLDPVERRILQAMKQDQRFASITVIRAAIADVLDAGWKCGAECDQSHNWVFSPQDEREDETARRGDFMDAVCAAITTLQVPPHGMDAELLAEVGKI